MSTQTSESATAARRPRRRRVLVLVALLGLLLGAFLARGLIVSALARRALAERDFRCAPLALDVDWRLRAVRSGPTRCERSRGRVAVVALPAGASLELDGLSPRSLDVPTLELELRDRGSLDAVGLGLATDQVPDPLRRALVALAALAARTDDPSMRVGELRITRSRGVIVLRDVMAARDERGLDVAAATITPDAADVAQEGSAPFVWRLERARGRVEPATATLRGELIVGVGAEELRVGLRLRAEGLDTDDPQFELSFDASPALERIRARWQRIAPDLGRIGDMLRGLRERGEDAPVE